MLIFVKCFGAGLNQTIKLDLEPAATVGDLEATVIRKLPDLKIRRLLFAGKQLASDKQLVFYDIYKESTVQLLGKLEPKAAKDDDAPAPDEKKKEEEDEEEELPPKVLRQPTDNLLRYGEMLVVHVSNARNLIAADLNGFSDPYVVLALGSRTARTRIVKKDLNPDWGEVFILPLDNDDRQAAAKSPKLKRRRAYDAYTLAVMVWDHDFMTPDDFLGSTEIKIDKLGHDETVERYYELEGVNTGEVMLSIRRRHILSPEMGHMIDKLCATERAITKTDLQEFGVTFEQLAGDEPFEVTVAGVDMSTSAGPGPEAEFSVVSRTVTNLALEHLADVLGTGQVSLQNPSSASKALLILKSQRAIFTPDQPSRYLWISDVGDANGVSERRLHRYLSKVVPGCLKALFYVHHACCAFAWFTTCESAVVALIDLNKRGIRSGFGSKVEIGYFLQGSALAVPMTRPHAIRVLCKYTAFRVWKTTIDRELIAGQVLLSDDEDESGAPDEKAAGKDEDNADDASDAVDDPSVRTADEDKMLLDSVAAHPQTYVIFDTKYGSLRGVVRDKPPQQHDADDDDSKSSAPSEAEADLAFPLANIVDIYVGIHTEDMWKRVIALSAAQSGSTKLTSVKAKLLHNNINASMAIFVSGDTADYLYEFVAPSEFVRDSWVAALSFLLVQERQAGDKAFTLHEFGLNNSTGAAEASKSNQKQPMSPSHSRSRSGVLVPDNVDEVMERKSSVDQQDENIQDMGGGGWSVSPLLGCLQGGFLDVCGPIQQQDEDDSIGGVGRHLEDDEENELQWVPHWVFLTRQSKYLDYVIVGYTSLQDSVPAFVLPQQDVLMLKTGPWSAELIDRRRHLTLYIKARSAEEMGAWFTDFTFLRKVRRLRAKMPGQLPSINLTDEKSDPVQQSDAEAAAQLYDSLKSVFPNQEMLGIFQLLTSPTPVDAEYSVFCFICKHQKHLGEMFHLDRDPTPGLVRSAKTMKEQAEQILGNVPKKTGLGVCRQCLSRSAVKWVTRLSSVLSLPQDQQSEARKAALQELDTQFSVQDLRDLLSLAQFQVYLDATAFALVESSDDFIQCPSCRSTMEAAPHTADSRLNNKVKLAAARGLDNRPIRPAAQSHYIAHRFLCRNCNKDFCRQCRLLPYHLGFDCAGYEEFKNAPKCRFCGSSVLKNTQMPNPPCEAFHNVCNSEECIAKTKYSCTKKLKCGHFCFGFSLPDLGNEEKCPPCLVPDCNGGVQGDDEKKDDEKTAQGGGLKLEADGPCGICYTEDLGQAPVLVLECKHAYHLKCVEMRIEKKWSGARIVFDFLKCPVCRRLMKPLYPAPHIDIKIQPLLELQKQVEERALQRLKFESLEKHPKIVDKDGQFYNDPAGFAMNHFSFFRCYECAKPYFAGARECGANDEEVDPKELVCAKCQNVESMDDCPTHGSEWLTFKCRYCCSLSTFHCWGKTHFCDKCHASGVWTKLAEMRTGKNKKKIQDYTQCPGLRNKIREIVNDRRYRGQAAKEAQMKKLLSDPATCPLGIRHPPNGFEFGIGCGLCSDKSVEEKNKEAAAREEMEKLRLRKARKDVANGFFSDCKELAVPFKLTVKNPSAADVPPGAFHRIGTRNGKKPYKNPGEEKIVEVELSSVGAGNAVSHCILDAAIQPGKYKKRFVVTEDKPYSYILIDTHHISIKPTHYVLKYNDSQNAPISWVLEGSEAGLCWTRLDEQKECFFLQVEAAHLFPITGYTQHYSKFRFTQTGANSDSNHTLHLEAIELYGHMAPSKPDNETEEAELKLLQLRNKASEQRGLAEIRFTSGLHPDGGVDIVGCEHGLVAVHRKSHGWQAISAGSMLSKGQHYCEFVIESAPNTPNSWKFSVGVVSRSFNYRKKRGWVGSQPRSWGYIAGTGGKVHNSGSSLSYGAKYAQGDKIGVGLDFSKRTIQFFKNGAPQGVAYRNLTGPVQFAVSMHGSGSAIRIVPNAALPASFTSAMPKSAAVPKVESLQWSRTDGVLGVRVIGTTFKTTDTDRWHAMRASQCWYSGAHYFEVKIVKSAYTANTWKFAVGVVPVNFNFNTVRSWIGSQKGSYSFLGNGGKCTNSGQSVKYARGYDRGDIVGVKVDLSYGVIEFFVNGVSQGVAFTGVRGPVYPAVSVHARFSEVQLMEAKAAPASVPGPAAAPAAPDVVVKDLGVNDHVPIDIPWDERSASCLIGVVGVQGRIARSMRSTDQWRMVKSKVALSEGVKYFEVKILVDRQSSNWWRFSIGVVRKDVSLAGSRCWVGSTAGGWGYIGGTGQKVHNSGQGIKYGDSYTAGDTVGVLCDFYRRTITFYKNGVSQGVAYRGLTGVVYPAVSFHHRSAKVQSVSGAPKNILLSPVNRAPRKFAAADIEPMDFKWSVGSMFMSVNDRVARNFSGAPAWGVARGNRSAFRKKMYYQVKITNVVPTNNFWKFSVGLVTGNFNLNDRRNWVGSQTGSYGYIGGTGGKVTNSGQDQRYGSPYGINDIIGVLADFDNGTVEFFKNGVSQGIAFRTLKDTPTFPAVSAHGKGNSVEIITQPNLLKAGVQLPPPPAFAPLSPRKPPDLVPLDEMLFDPTSMSDGLSMPSAIQVNANRNIGNKWRAIRTLTVIESGVKYFGMKIIADPATSNLWHFSFGMVSTSFNVNAPRCWIGAQPGSYGYIAKTGGKVCGSGQSTPYGKPYGVKDLVGIKVDLNARTIEFFVNGVSQGIAFTGVTGPLYPAVSMHAAGAKVMLAGK